MSATKSICTLLLTTTALCATNSQTFAEDVQFEGSSSNWGDQRNWSSGEVPSSKTDVVISGRPVDVVATKVTARKVELKEGGVLNLIRGATAGSVTITNVRSLLTALGGSTLGSASIINANGGHVLLLGGSDGGSARIHNVAGELLVTEKSTLGSATVNNAAEGIIIVETASNVGSANVQNVGGLFYLLGQSTLGTASILNDDKGNLVLSEGSSGGYAAIHNNPGYLILGNKSTLDNATVTNDAGSFVLFDQDSRGQAAKIINNSGGTIQSTAFTTSPMEIGSLSGAGDVYLGTSGLISGGLGKTDVIAGAIHDGFSQSYLELRRAEGFVDFLSTQSLSLSGLRKVGVGTLTLTGTNTYSGGTTIEAGTLQLGDGGTSGSIEGDIANNAKLVFKRSDDVISTNTISGTGEIVQAGPGALLLTADSSDFAGKTTVENGRLLVGKAGQGAVLGGSVTVLEGAKLGGSGTVGSGAGSVTSISSGGTLAAGNSVGTLTIDGDLRLAPGSDFETEIAGDGRSDLVNVTGTADLAGSSLRVVPVDAETSYQNEQSYRILNAEGGVNGVFSDVAVDSAFLNAGLIYAPKSVDLKIALANDPGYLFPTVAETSNQLATARGLDTLAQSGSSLALYNDLLMLNANDARASFDRLSGEAYASAAGVLVDQSHFVRGAMNGRMQQAFGVRATSDVQDTTPYFAWSNAYGAWGSYDGDSLAAEVKSSIGGFASGIDVEVDTWRVGIMAGYGHSNFDVNALSSSGDSKNYTLGTYAASQWTLSESSALNFRSGLAHTWHDLSMNRDVAFPGFSDRLSSEYDASMLQLFGEVGYQLKMDRTLFEPYANVGFVRFSSDGFGENGGTAASLSVTSATMNTGFTTIGLRATTEFDIGETMVTARGDIGWRHSYGDVTPASTASFVGSQAFTVSGAPIARDVALIEAGFDIHLTKSAKLGVSYNGQFGSGAINNGVNAKLSVQF